MLDWGGVAPCTCPAPRTTPKGVASPAWQRVAGFPCVCQAFDAYAFERSAVAAGAGSDFVLVTFPEPVVATDGRRRGQRLLSAARSSAGWPAIVTPHHCGTAYSGPPRRCRGTLDEIA